jgi:hypothetical protein
VLSRNLGMLPVTGMISGTYLRADETAVDVKMHEGQGKIIKPVCGNTADLEKRLGSTSVQRLAHFTPAAWLAHHS